MADHKDIVRVAKETLKRYRPNAIESAVAFAQALLEEYRKLLVSAEPDLSRNGSLLARQIAQPAPPSAEEPSTDATKPR